MVYDYLCDLIRRVYLRNIMIFSMALSFSVLEGIGDMKYSIN